MFIDQTNNYLRSLSLTRWQPLPSYQPNANYFYRAQCLTFDTRTDTLLVVANGYNDANCCLMSLFRGENKWDEVNCLPTEIANCTILEIGLCGSRVLLPNSRHRLHAIDVNAQHFLHTAGTIAHEFDFISFACTLIGADAFVAFIEEVPASVSLYRLVELRLEKLDSFDLIFRPQSLLFRGDLLLATCSNEDNNKEDVIVSLRATAEGFTRGRKLLDSDAAVDVDAWCLVADRLVLWDYNSKDLLVYALE